MKRIADLRGPTDLRVVYSDLDGTLLGPGGSLFTTPASTFTDRPARALRALHASGISLVLVSGRTRRGLENTASVLGASAYIAELGALLVEGSGPEERVTWNGAAPEDHAPLVERITRSGAGAFLLERFPGRLEPVAPWTEASLMFVGLVDPVEGNVALDEAGYGWLELHDNGRLQRRLPSLDLPEIHALHLLPRGVSKASAVRLHRERHEVPLDAAIAVGDSPSDLSISSEVGAFFMVANGARWLEELASIPENVYVTRASHGEGFAEVVEALLPI